MFKDNRFIDAGENEFYRFGHKAVEKVQACLVPNESGYYSIPADGGKYWTFGTSKGKYGDFAKYNGIIFSVNGGGFIYAKAGTDKGNAFVKMLNDLIQYMNERNAERGKTSEDEEEEN